MTVIETNSLTKDYRSRGKGLRAVDGISFKVDAGQIFGFLGPNGSGKTTTIGMLLGIINPTAGNVLLLGREGAAGLHESRQQIGATLETPNFYPYLSGRDNLRVVATVKGSSTKAIDDALDVVGLTKRQKDRFETYSLGMKQRLALAATLLGDPELIILDEPANGLDPEGMREIRAVIRGFAERGKTVFLSSHLLAEVERTCTHVAIISKGRIVKQSSVHDLTTSTMTVIIRSADLTKLRDIAAQYQNAASARLDGENVIVQLMSGDAAALNEFVAGHGIYLSHLALQPVSLEDVFMDLTQTDTMAGVA